MPGADARGRPIAPPVERREQLAAERLTGRLHGRRLHVRADPQCSMIGSSPPVNTIASHRATYSSASATRCGSFGARRRRIDGVGVRTARQISSSSASRQTDQWRSRGHMSIIGEMPALRRCAAASSDRQSLRRGTGLRSWLAELASGFEIAEAGSVKSQRRPPTALMHSARSERGRSDRNGQEGPAGTMHTRHTPAHSTQKEPPVAARAVWGGDVAFW